MLLRVSRKGCLTVLIAQQQSMYPTPQTKPNFHEQFFEIDATEWVKMQVAGTCIGVSLGLEEFQGTLIFLGIQDFVGYGHPC